MRPPISAANRGKAFESFIAYANRAYFNHDIAVIEKQNVEILPIRNGRGKIISAKIGAKSTIDYLGRYYDKPIGIEAKHTSDDTIRFDAVQDHQARYLEAYTRGGRGIGLVLVSFNLDRFYAVPAAFWIAAREAWADAQRKRKRTAEKVTITRYGQTWTTPGKASVRAEELLPEWEVFTHPNYGLHYLKNIQRYIEPPKFINYTGGNHE